jgi:XXXCH domain-containing protein
MCRKRNSLSAMPSGEMHMADHLLKMATDISEEQVDDLLKLLTSWSENEIELDADKVLESAVLGKLKLSLVRQGEGFFLKVKGQAVKPLRVEEERDESGAYDLDAAEFDSDMDAKPKGKIKYKALKKRMKKPWKIIKDSAEMKTMPPADIVESFLEDSALMITYPGKGDEYYKPYAVAHEAFAAAWRAGDVEAMAHAVNRMDHLKEACHDVHK